MKATFEHILAKIPTDPNKKQRRYGVDGAKYCADDIPKVIEIYGDLSHAYASVDKSDERGIVKQVFN